jgi:penicillin-binding protein 1A
VTSTLNQANDPAAALVSIDDTGAVRAMIGGRDFNSSKVNLAVGTEGGGGGRQPGSSFKPFTLAEALTQGVPLTKTYNAPATITIPKADNGADYKVGNYADAGLGTLDLVSATAKSSNTAYVQLANDIGPANIVSMAERLGVESPLKPNLSLTLGTDDVSVLDMASAYSTFADNGEHVDPFVVAKVTDADGNVLYEHESVRDRVLDEKVAGEVNYALSQVVQAGTGTGAKIPGQTVAGKTGTTENYKDAWFAGFTCKLTTAVWMGYPDANLDGTPKYMSNVHGIKVTGGSLPTTIWQRYMAKATQGQDSCEYPRPVSAPVVPPSTTAPPSTSTSSTTEAPSTTTTVAPTSTTASPSTTSTTRATPAGGPDD